MGVVQNGKHRIVERMEHSLESDKWYRFWIEVRAGHFYLKMYEEIVPNMAIADVDLLEELFHAEDHSLSSGQMGFMTNKAKATYFDHFQLAPLECWKDSEIDISIHAP